MTATRMNSKKTLDRTDKLTRLAVAVHAGESHSLVESDLLLSVAEESGGDTKWFVLCRCCR